VKPVIAIPQLQVSISGRLLGAKALDTLCEVRVRSILSAPTLCELTFLNPPGGFSAEPGAAMRVEIRGSDPVLFSGEVTALEYGYQPSGARQLRLRGYDLLHRLRKRQPVRAHVQTSAGDLAREMAAELGLTVEAPEPGPLWRRMLQWRQSDLDFLVDMAERCGLYLTVRDDVLLLLTLKGIGEPIKLQLGDKLIEARIEVNSNSSCRKVVVSAWDSWRIEERAGEALEPRSGRNVEAAADPGQVGGSGVRVLTNLTAQNDQHADAAAQAELDSLAADEVVLWALAAGDPALVPGGRIEIIGVDAEVSGSYVITTVTHTIDSLRGYISEISSAAPPRPPVAERGLIGTLGIVSKIADPDNLGRVQVQLPAFSGIESDWMGLAAPGAGANKGMVSLPEVGDQVLVVMQADDLSQGLVLGGLHGTKLPPDWGIEGGSVRRFGLFTPGGNRLQLDDGHRSIRIQDAGGSYLELAPAKVLLHAATDLEIEAPGHGVTVRGASIDFARG
jgi:phage protein D/phage baseplate assembly protein gpV